MGRLRTIAIVFCVLAVAGMVAPSISLAGPLGIFPNFHPLRPVGLAVGNAGCAIGAGVRNRREARQSRREAHGERRVGRACGR